MNDYIEFREECLLIDAIDVTTVVGLINEYKPNFVSTVSNESRVMRLKTVARAISYLSSRIPPRKYQVGLGKYSLDTDEEARSLSGYVWRDGLENHFARFDPFATASSNGRRGLQARVDWVEAGAVTEVKDQARCGCCWAVATAAAVESATYLTKGSSKFLQSLSFQQMISCDDDNNGCGGGNIVSFVLHCFDPRTVPSMQSHLR